VLLRPEEIDCRQAHAEFFGARPTRLCQLAPKAALVLMNPALLLVAHRGVFTGNLISVSVGSGRRLPADATAGLRWRKSSATILFQKRKGPLSRPFPRIPNAYG